MIVGAFDIGGTKTIVGLFSGKNIIDTITFSTDREHPDVHIRKCSEALSSLAHTYGISEKEVSGLGATVPGIASADGVLIHSAYPEWNGKNIRNLISCISGIENVCIENDVNACALAEGVFNNGLSFSNYLWITVSTGIGGAVVIDKRIYKGFSGGAGEIGHVKVEYENPLSCPSCGGMGCLEAHASGTAIGRMFMEEAGRDPELMMALQSRNMEADASSCASFAREGNASALRCFSKAADYLARGIGYAVNILNPEAVVIGGGVANSFDLMYNQILKGIDRYVHPNLLPVGIVRTKLGYMAGLMGAASLIITQNAQKGDCYDT